MSRLSLRWAVLDCNLDPIDGHEQGVRRPTLVVSYEPFHRSGLATVVPVTSARTEPRYRGDVVFPAETAGLERAGVFVVSQVRTVSLRRFDPPQHVRYVEDPDLRRGVRAALLHHLGLDLPERVDLA